jgi:hypothetical protein
MKDRLTTINGGWDLWLEYVEAFMELGVRF